MPQHIWIERRGVRRCEACQATQRKVADRWSPWIGSICKGDGRDSSRRDRPLPSGDAPSRKLETV